MQSARTNLHVRGEPLGDHLRHQLAEIVRTSGEHGALKHLGIPRATLARALAGLGLRRGTIAMLRGRLFEVTKDKP
jgi:hypothetical protein